MRLLFVLLFASGCFINDSAHEERLLEFDLDRDGSYDAVRGGDDCDDGEDGDGDGVGELLEYCTGETGFGATGDDCDDTNPDRYSGAFEDCDNIDNDCDLTGDQGMVMVR